VQLLLEGEAAHAAQHPDNGWTALLFAASACCYAPAAAMRLLLAAGADVNYTATDGFAALMGAAQAP
jgi:ankyrin repeat protein